MCSPGGLQGTSTQSHQSPTPLLAPRFHPLSLSHLNSWSHMFNFCNWIKLAQQQFSWMLLKPCRREGKGWTISLLFINDKLMLIKRVNLISPSGSQQTLVPVFWSFSHAITYLGQKQIQSCLFSSSGSEIAYTACLFNMRLWNCHKTSWFHKLPVISHLIISRTT